MAQGYLQVDVVSDVNSFPVQDADVAIARTEEPDKIIEETRTNSSGQTENLSLDAPPPELSLSPEETERPYAEYTIRITAPGFKPFLVSGCDGDPGDPSASAFQCTDRRADADGDDPGSYALWGLSSKNRGE